MNKSYVEYALRKCSDKALYFSTHHYKTKDELLSEAQKGFCGKDNLLEQRILVKSALFFVCEIGYIDSKNLGNDAGIVYSRIVKKLKGMESQIQKRQEIDLDKMFDTLVEVNWLLSSQYAWDDKRKEGRVQLLESQNRIQINLRKVLEEILYESALKDKDRSEQYESAMGIKTLFLPGTHPDQEVRELFAQGYRYSDFERRMKQAKEFGFQTMSLFYALTATAALYEEYRRIN